MLESYVNIRVQHTAALAGVAWGYLLGSCCLSAARKDSADRMSIADCAGIDRSALIFFANITTEPVSKHRVLAEQSLVEPIFPGIDFFDSPEFDMIPLLDSVGLFDIDNPRLTDTIDQLLAIPDQVAFLVLVTDFAARVYVQRIEAPELSTVRPAPG